MAEQQPVIIIKKIKKGGHGGHHGGAWKVAYADFVTAMMSFFLLMWLLNTTTSDQRQGLAEYFAPTGISQSYGGSGGVMGGMSISADYGADVSASHAPGLNDRASATVGKGAEGDEDVPGKSEKSGGGDGDTHEANKDAPDLEAAEVALAKRYGAALAKEEEGFKNAEGILRAALQQSPALKELGKYLFIDRTPEGLRIQIVDQDKFSLFPSSSSIPYKKGRDLLNLVGRVVARLPNDISITGHTDSKPFVTGSRRDNWGLSLDRANVSRRELQNGGVPSSRISRVVGRADRDPFIKSNPNDSRNRRISIVLLREAAQAKSNYEPTPKNN